MRIALTLLSGVGYGGVTYFRHLLPALAARDRENEYHVFVAAGSPLLAAVQGNNFYTHVVRHARWVGARFLWEQVVLPIHLFRLHADVLYTAKNIAVFLAPCRVVTAIRNVEPFFLAEMSGNRRLRFLAWMKWQLTRWSVRRASRIVGVSAYVATLVRNRFPHAASRVVVVYNGNPAVRTASAVARPSDVPFILTASKFVPYANQQNLVRGYALLAQRRPETPALWLVGGVHDPIYFATVQRAVADERIGDRVRFIGLLPHAELLALYPRAQAFVFPSTLESCPHTLIEAMASGVPVAAAHAGPMPEIGGRGAVYFDPRSPADIAAVMEAVLGDPALRATLSREGSARAGAFTWEKTAQGIFSALTDPS